jgi:hypothetical protein
MRSGYTAYAAAAASLFAFVSGQAFTDADLTLEPVTNSRTSPNQGAVTRSLGKAPERAPV